MRLRMICADKSLLKGPGYLAAGHCYRVGRSSRCAFVVDDLSVSRVHAEVTANEETVRIRDLNSRNGTFIEDERIEEGEVQPGQAVRFGRINFHLIGDEPADAHLNSEISTRFTGGKASLQPAGLKQLSQAQLGVLELLLTGLSEKEVASRLTISQHTVHNHVKEVYRKMGVNSRPELLALFVEDAKKPAKPRK